MLFINIQRYESDTNEILISATTSTIEQMKYEIAFELESHWDLIHHIICKRFGSVERLQNA